VRQTLDAGGSCQKAVNGCAAQHGARALSVQSVRTGGYRHGHSWCNRFL